MVLANQDNPYIGLEAYSEEESDYFCGRDQEKAELFRLLKRRVLTLFYGASGIGKTSLLRAGLFPILRENGFLPVYLRLDFGSKHFHPLSQLRAVIAEEIHAREVDVIPPDEAESLWEYFHLNPFFDSKNRLLTPVLVFDQFEELFTFGRADTPAKEFTRALADVIENRIPDEVRDRLESGEELPYRYEIPKIKAIISLREDYLPQLDDLRPVMPSLAVNRFRLKNLNGEDALDAVLKPGSHVFDRQVAEQLVRFVAAAGDEMTRDAAIELRDLEVESALLSLICRELCSRRSGDEKISAELLKGARHEILSDFYRRNIGDLSPAVRLVVEERLITLDGFRTTVALAEILRLTGVTSRDIDLLVNRRLLRREQRLGILHVELVHDVLTKVVRESRERRHRARERRRHRTAVGIAAGASLVVFLAAAIWILGLGIQTLQVTRWKLTTTDAPGETEVPGELTLYVRDLEHLRRRSVQPVFVDRAGIGDYSWSGSVGVEFDSDEHGELRIRFTKAASGLLPRATVYFEGRGTQTFMSYLLVGSFEVVQDVVPPSISDVGVDLGPDAGRRDAGPGGKLRLRPEARLTANVVDEHLGEVYLAVELLDGGEPGQQLPPIPGTEADGHMSFPLYPLKSGRYRARIIATDKAGSRTQSALLEFRIDDSVDFVVTQQDRQRFLAESKAFYECLPGERIRALEGRAQGTTSEWSTIEVFPMPLEVETSLEFSRLLADSAAPLSAVPLEEMEESKSYLLAIPVDMFSVELRVTDTTEPANQTILRSLNLVAPPKFKAEEISVLLGIPREKLEPEDGGSILGFRAPRPLNTAVLDELRIEFPRERVHWAECTLRSSDGSSEDVQPDSISVNPGYVSLRSLNLAENQENALTTTLHDPLNRRFRLRVIVSSDTAPPDFAVSIRYGREGRLVKSREDVTLSLETEEALEEARAIVHGETILGKPLDAFAPRWTFDLDRLALIEGGFEVEGDYPIEVVATDLAGNRDSRWDTLTVNKGEPRVRLPGIEWTTDTMLLTSNELVLDIQDGNGINYAEATVTLRYRGSNGRETEFNRRIERPEQGQAINVSLRDLPDDCRGTLSLSVPDTLGLTFENSWSFELRRPRDFWHPVVNWRDVVWVRVRTVDNGVFYISRHEISNAVYARDDTFISGGEYVDKLLRTEYVRPKYWGPGGEFPTYTKDGKRIPGNSFPVVGVSIEEAEAFARTVLKARLPTWEEWYRAARKENESPRNQYPWRDADAGRDYSNCYGVWTSPSSPFSRHHYDRLMIVPHGREVECRAVQVDFNPFDDVPEVLRERLAYSGDILHLIGNVGELVRWQEAASGYGVAGGDFSSNYGDIDVQGRGRLNPKAYVDDPSRDDRSARTGFRVVIDVKAADPMFLRRARASSEQLQ